MLLGASIGWWEPTNHLDHCYFYSILPVVTKIWEPSGKKRVSAMGLACKTVIKNVNNHSVARKFFPDASQGYSCLGVNLV